MIHLSHTAIYFATVVSSVRLEIQTGGAKRGPAIVVAYKDVFQPEVFHAWLAITR
jgi:hypothetical protein